MKIEGTLLEPVVRKYKLIGACAICLISFEGTLLSVGHSPWWSLGALAALYSIMPLWLILPEPPEFASDIRGLEKMKRESEARVETWR
jgi:hypothetical protein